MTTYIFNVPVLPNYGCFDFQGPLTIRAARALVATGFRSAVGPAAAAELLSSILGVVVPVVRRKVKMRAGDEALILRLLGDRLPEGAILSASEMLERGYALGRLRRTR